MTTPQTKKRTTLVQRTAFTIAELLVVMLIIGILAGIAAPFIFEALNRAREFSIQNEVGQLDAAIRRFETENGFFPPAIGPGLEIDTTDPSAFRVFRRYLNRIAPTHDEGTGISNDGLQIWWNAVGSKLDEQSSLVFWLSGLCTNKQYPLSGSAALQSSMTPLAPYNVNKDISDADLPSGVNIDRNVLFDFDLGRVVSNVADGSADGIKAYTQPFGKDIEGSLLAYQYRDFRSYGTQTAYHIDNPDASATQTEIFFNPDSFQIICPGMDGVVATGNIRNVTSETNVNSSQDDNITNFSGGRLERCYGG